MAQITYPLDPAQGIAGMLCDTRNKTTESFFSEESTNEIPYGFLVVQGTQDKTCKNPTAIGNKLLGIAEYTLAHLPGPNGGIIPTQAVDVLTKGGMWVVCEDGCTPSSPVYGRFVTNGSNIAGGFRASTDGSNCVLLLGSRWLSTASAGGLAKLAFDLEAHRAAAGL